MAIGLTVVAPLAFGAALAVAADAAAQTSQPPGDERARSGYDESWARLTQWYRSESNPVVQQVLFSGRYHHDFAVIDADQGTHHEWNVRRMRLGPRITLFRSLTLHTEVELNPQERDPLYVRITDAYVQWNRSTRLAITVGKQGVPFTMEGATSSKELLTIDRSNLANNLWFPQEYLPGVALSGSAGGWNYRGGVYSAGAMNREFGEFNGGSVTLALLGYDFADALGGHKAVLTGNYVYQQPDRNNTFTRQLEHVVSANIRLDRGTWGLHADLSLGSGYLAQGDLRALVAMPFVNLTRRLQVVGRYTWIDSDAPNAIRFGTYESRVVSGRGDEYRELYIGANHYFYGHRLKLQTGLQWADMRDRASDGGEYSGLAWTTGLRTAW